MTPVTDLFALPIVLQFEKIALNYAMDAFFIGIVIAFSCLGRRKGFLDTLRILLPILCVLGTCYCFYLPFSARATNPDKVLLYGLIARCIEAMKSITGWILVAPILGKLLAGILMVVCVISLYALLNWLLGKAVKWTKSRRFTRDTDGVMAFGIWFIVGLVVCFVVWVVWCILARYGIFNVQELLGEKARLSNGIYHLVNRIIQP